MSVDFDKVYDTISWDCGNESGIFHGRSLGYITELIEFDRKWWQIWKPKLNAVCVSQVVDGYKIDTEVKSFTISTYNIGE